MLHKYRKKVPIEAEQFDGSTKMRREYGIRNVIINNGFDDYGETVLPVETGFDFDFVNPITKGDWIICTETGCYPMPNNIFRKTYERCD